MGYGPPIHVARAIYHRAEQEASETPPEELLAAILMLTARSEATAAAIDVEWLRATGQ